MILKVSFRPEVRLYYQLKQTLIFTLTRPEFYLAEQAYIVPT